MRRALHHPDPATLLGSLVRNIPGAYYRCAVDPDWTMYLIGEEIERITGYPADDFVDNRRRSYGSVIHPDDLSLAGQLRPGETIRFVVVGDHPVPWFRDLD